MMACAGGHEAVVDKLMQAGADINAKNKEGCTALSIAKKNNHEGVILKLQQHGKHFKRKEIKTTKP